MANPLQIILTSGIQKKEKRNDAGIKELVSRVFSTRNTLHLAHLKTNSFATHMALGELYDQVIEDTDEIVETFQGKFGVIPDLQSAASTVPDDIASHVKQEADWVEKNRSKIANGDTAIENLVDTLLGHLHKTHYKLTSLH
jgi:hypothetical protein